MTVLLTMVSVLALWAFLTELVVGLLLVFKTLESIRGALQQIAFGVRAIERETAPLDRLADDLPRAAEELHGALSGLARGTGEVGGTGRSEHA
jgi:hypothetical protein